MQSILVMFRSSGERRSFSVTREITVIGRREDCDLIIPLGEVSRKHCRLVRDGDLLKVEDLGSANGTYLNGQRVQESLLAPGDTVQVGPVVFVLQIDGVPADDELRPVIAEAATDVGGGGAPGDVDVHSSHPDDLEPIDINGSVGGVELSDMEDSGAPVSPKRVPPPVPPGMEDGELDLSDAPAGDIGDLDLLEIEPEHEEQHRS